jgi:hypothetical protein
MVDFNFSFSTGSNGSESGDAGRSDSPVDLSDVDTEEASSGSDGFSEPSPSDDVDDSIVEKIHEKDDHRATDLHEAEYKTGYRDLAADFLRRYRLYIVLLLIGAAVYIWRFGNFPRWFYFFSISFALSLALTWSWVFNQISKLDDEIDNVAIEVSPEDDAETHGYIVGDGALPEFESRNDVPPYPQQGTEADVFEVEHFDTETQSAA